MAKTQYALILAALAQTAQTLLKQDLMPLVQAKAISHWSFLDKCPNSIKETADLPKPPIHFFLVHD